VELVEEEYIDQQHADSLSLDTTAADDCLKEWQIRSLHHRQKCISTQESDRDQMTIKFNK
jgi:hypothetical protein